MKISRKRTSAFTLAELIIAGAVSVILSVGFMIYTSSALRMMIRNMATNHSHETARASLERLLSEVHNADNRFQLINFDGTNYSDVTATATTDQDAYSQLYCSNRANGVRFMVVAGGPFRIVGNGTSTSVASTDTTVQFDFGTSTYTPLAGDKVQFPLLSREYDIVSSPAPTKSGTLWTVTLSGQIGNQLTTTTGTTPPNITTGVFYHRVAYFVWNNELIYDPGYPPPSYPTKPISVSPYAPPPTPPVKQMALIKKNVTSPKPFALLFPTSTSTFTDALNLRVSLESYDLQYSARVLQNGTTTLQAVIPSRNRPSVLSTN